MGLLLKELCVVLLIGYVWSQTTMSTQEAARIKALMVEQCKKNITDLTDDEIDLILIKRGVPKTKAGSCFSGCVLKNVGYFYPNNSINVQTLQDRLDRTKDQAPPEEYPKKMEILKFCKSNETVHTDECVAAKKFIECCFAKKTELAVTSKLW